MAREVHRHGTRHGPRHDDEAVRITTAATSRDAEISGRERRYIVSMGIRTVCFIAAVLVGQGVLRWVLVAAALLLPYVAVVMANAVRTKDDGFDLPNRQYVRELEDRSDRDTPD